MRQRFFILLLIGLACCKTKTNVVTPPIQLDITVLDTNAKPLTFKVPFYLFNNISAYSNASAYYTGTGNIATDTTVNGKCVFTGLASGTTNYYVYAHYKDTTVLKYPYYIDYDNSDNYSISSVFFNSPSSTSTPTVTGSIIMKPRDGLVGFWTQDINKGTLPIKIIVDNDAFGTGPLNATITTQPSSYRSAGLINGLIKNGTHKYYATSTNGSGCVWEETEFIVKGGENFTIQLPPCNSGTLIFWSSDTTQANYPIVITANGKVRGTLTKPLTAAPDCASAEASVSDAGGTVYIYEAQSLGKPGCVYTSNPITIQSGICVPIQIANCQND